MIVLSVVPHDEARNALDAIPERILHQMLFPATFTVKLAGDRAMCVRQVPAKHGRSDVAPFRLEVVGKVTATH